MRKRNIGLLLATVMLTLCVLGSNAKTITPNEPVCGIYKTAADFAQKKVTHAIYSIDKKNRLLLHAMFGSKKIDIVDAGTKTSFLRSEIFGYKDNGVDYRIDGDNALTIVDTNTFVLYSSVKVIPGMKGHDTKETVYYFSKDVNAEAVCLTKENLKAAFASNNRFRYYLDAFFKSDKDLIAFDAQLKEYKLKYIYDSSIKEDVQAKSVYKPIF